MLRKLMNLFRSKRLTPIFGRSLNFTVARRPGHSATSRAFRSKRERQAQLSGLKRCCKTFASRSACCGALLHSPESPCCRLR